MVAAPVAQAQRTAAPTGGMPGIHPAGPDGMKSPANLPLNSGALLHTLMASTSDGIVVTDANGTILMINPAFTRVTGYSADEAIGQKTSLLRSGRHDRAFYETLWAALETENQWKGEIWNRSKSGEIYLEWLRIFRVVDPEHGAVRHIGIFTDITDHHRAEERELTGDDRDALTGLMTRTRFLQRLEAAVRHARQTGAHVGLLIVNIDRFRRINEHFGHAVGDTVLVSAAHGLRRRLPAGDAIARLSGDEFAILLSAVSDARLLTEVARSLQQGITAAGDAAGLTTPLTASVGLALMPEDGDTPDELMRHAAAAVDEAHKQGDAGIACHSSSAAARTGQRFRLEAALRRAIRTQAFTLVYQPRIDMRRHTLVGAEALLRWHDPDLGEVSPATFIPVAEETGLIREIGDWVLEEVARTAAIWRQTDLPAIPLAANVSALQLSDDRIVEHVRHLLHKYGLPPSALQIEVTETALIRDADRARTVLSGLRACGIQVSLDDFGTGFATLSALRDLPVDEIKIDRSYISPLDQASVDRADMEIVRMIVALGGALGKDIVAEGVETERQAALLRGMGCNLAQGWLYGRPMPLQHLMGQARRSAGILSGQE